MKSRVLPLSLVTLVVLLGAFMISATIIKPGFLPAANNDSGQEAMASEAFLAMLRNNQLTGSLDPADVINARLQAEKIALQNGSREDFFWSFLGPNNVGGRTRALIFDNTDAGGNTIIAGAVSGGLYKSTDGGLIWYKLNGEKTNLNVSCLAQAPDGTLYAGTGEGFTIQNYSLFQDLGYNGAFVGSGIYKSTDGESFNLLGATAPAANNDTANFAYVNRLAVNPVSNVVYAATNNGLWFSTDEGISWNMAKVGDTAYLTGNSYDVKTGSDGITAACVDGLAYISDIGQPNQFVLHAYDTFNLPYENVGRVEFAIAPSNPDILYATAVNNLGGMINVYRSDDRGINWRIIAPGGSVNLNFFSPDNNVNQGRGLYNNTLAVFPENPDRILLGGINLWEGNKINETGFFEWTRKSDGTIPPEFFPQYVQQNHHTYVFRPGSSNQFFIGHDGGISQADINPDFNTYVLRNKTYNTSQFSTVAISGKIKKVAGGAHGAGTQFINGHSNPATAKYGTQIWSGYFPSGGNGGECFISAIDPMVFLYTRTPGEFFRRSEDEGANFSNTFLPAAVQVPATAFITPCLYWESFENEYSRDSVDFIANKELPSGTKVMVHSQNRDYPFEYTLPVTLNPNDTLRVKDIVSSKFFLATTDNVFLSTDLLDFASEPVWYNIASKAKSDFEGVPLSMGMSADANYLFIGTKEGFLYRIANIKYAYDYDRADVNSPYCIIATSFIPLIDPATQAQNTQVITSVAVDPQNPAHVIVTMGNYGNDHYVFRSNNALDAEPVFTSVQSNLPKMPVFSSLIEMSNPNTVMIGTDMGLYISENINSGSPSWSSIENNIGDVQVFKLKQQLIAKEEVEIKFWNGLDTLTMTYPGTENYGVIYAATYGRGLFYNQKYQKPVGIFTPDPEINASSLNIYPNPVSHTATVEYTLDERSNVNIAVFDLNGRMLISEQLLQQAPGHNQYRLNCGNLPRGSYVISINTGKRIDTGKFIVVQ
jgi:hypothetical protein